LIPGARVVSNYVTVYGGFSMIIPANRAKDLAALGPVAAVQSNELRHASVGETPTPTPTPSPSESVEETPAPTPDATPEETTAPEVVTPRAEVALPPTTPAPDADATTFIGADKVWPSLGGRDQAGQGVIVGVIDSGIWPENPMLVDNGIPTPAGGPWECQFGDGTVGAAASCNDKLIGAYAFLDQYQVTAPEPAGAEDFCSAALCSARDSDGHGTHTATTAAGSYVETTPIYGVDRGAISGVAPGASIIAYRALGPAGGYEGDLVAAIQQAVIDGVDVINYSISGSQNPYDSTELAFLDAFAAGITVNSSAGNSGPAASTLDHASPWTTTVAASTSDRAFTSALVLSSSDGATFVKAGTTITDGVEPSPVVLPAQVAGYPGTQYCDEPFAPGSLEGQVVLCVRGGANSGGRVEKGYYASLGDAAGMILANPVPQDLQTDNHFLPAIQLEGPNDDVIAFITDHPDVTAEWAQGTATVSQGDVMAAFSSRGPVGDFLKPDITAPGVQVLAGNTPEPSSPAVYPGEDFQAIAGTSMSAPHAAGVSALVKAAHPTWTPGQIKSSLMTSSLQDVVNVDGSKAGVFDRGAGSIRADRAVNPVLTISETAADFAASAGDALHRIDLNIPSVYIDPLPGAVSTKRTVTNVSGKSQSFSVKATAASGLNINVFPSSFTLASGKSKDLTIILDALGAEDGWREGQITITPKSGQANKVVVPVAANVGEAQVSLTQTCDPTTIKRNTTTTCTVEAANYLPIPVEATIDVAANPLLQVRSVTAPAKKTLLGAKWSGTLDPALPPTIAAIEPSEFIGGYLDVSQFGATPVSLTDDAAANFNVPAFQYGGETYTRVGITSNGYVVVGGAGAGDVLARPQALPNPAAPNNVLAPLWTDLNPEAGGTISIVILTDGVDDWLVVDWSEVPTFSGNATNTFQTWIQLGATEGAWFGYGEDAVGDTAVDGVAGAENRDGSSGVQLATLPSAGDEYGVSTTPPQAGGVVTFDYTLRGLLWGTWSTWAQLKSDSLRAVPMELTKITVTR
ncbi:MAG: S8 family serine peptidase, partial [Microbacterium sp.]